MHSGPPGPKSQKKKSQKESFWGSAKKSPKIPEKVKKIHYKVHLFWVFFCFFGYFQGLFVILGQEGPETPVNGRSGRKDRNLQLGSRTVNLRFSLRIFGFLHPQHALIFQGKGGEPAILSAQSQSLAISALTEPNRSEIPQKEGVLGSESQPRNRRSLGTFYFPSHP